MTSNSTIVDWFTALGMNNLLSTEDILSGNTVHSVFKKTLDTYKNQFLTPASAVNKMNNWNNLIKSLEKINIKITNQEKSQILHGNQNTVYNILSQIKTYLEGIKKQPQIDINKIDHRSEPKHSKSLLQLFILVIIKNLGLNAKQSVALLSNDSKYLAHIMAKGFKQQSVPVMNLLKDFQSLLPQIHEFCVNKQNEVFFLKSVKPGLISKFKEISQLSLQILLKFSLNTQNPFQILKSQLMPTLILQYRRHPFFLNQICNLIIKLSKYTKPLLTVLTNNMNQKQLLTFCYQILCISQQNSQLKHFYSLAKVQEVVTVAIDSLSQSGNFSIALLMLIKMLETNFQIVAGQQKHLASIITHLQHLAINKKEHITAFTNGLFTFLHIFGSKKNSIAPAFFKLCVQKFKLALNEDESTNYAYNLLLILEQFPAIPNTMIVDAIVERYQNYKQVITDLDIALLIRIAFGVKRDNQDDEQLSREQEIKIPDEKTALKIYNILSKIFFQNVSNGLNIADAIIFIVRTHIQSQLISDLNMKMVKVSLAVHYANIRKLNMSKSIVEGIVKIDQTNAFAKRKNFDIEYLLRQLLTLKDQNFNKNVEPLICYSYIQSQSKNKRQSEGLARVLSILGNVTSLVRKYEEQVRILHEDKRKKKTYQPTDPQQQSKLNSISTDLINKKKLHPGQNYSMYLSKISKISNDAQKGLQKYKNVFEDKKKKVELDQIRKIQDEEKKQQLQKKYTLKVLQKGIRIDPKSDTLHQYLYEYNFKQNQLKKQQFYDLTSLHIFNPSQEEVNDLQALKCLMRKYNKVLKVFYNNYGGKLRPNSISLFDQLAEKQSLMQVANVWKLFKDYQLDEFMTVRQAQYLIQKLNSQRKKSYCDTGLLDFEAFEDFIIQASLTMFSRAPKNLSGHSISYMVEQTFYQFKMLAGQNKVDIRLFDDQLSIVQQDQSVSSLNLQLKKNPDYILPQGYKKIVEKRVEYYHSISLDAFHQSYTDVLDILDEICSQKLGLHILQPFSELTSNVYAKSLLSKKKQQNGDDFKEKYFSLNVKKQLFKFDAQDRQIARQAAFCLSQIVDAVQHGKKIVPKNKVVYRQIQQEKRKAEEEASKKRQKRDQELKKILQKHKGQKQKKKSQEVQQKQKQQKKGQQEKKKRQKYELQLKKKVQQYQLKKNEEKKKQEEQKLKDKLKQQQNFEKKRQQLSKVAKQIQQKKQNQKKIAEEKQKYKIQKQKALLKQKSKKNLKLRSSPRTAKKNQGDQKVNVTQQKTQKQNKNTAPITKVQQK